MLDLRECFYEAEICEADWAAILRHTVDGEENERDRVSS